MQMNGEGLYKYKKGDIYSGTFVDGLKHGEKGTYEYGEDQSRLTGTWEKGNFVTGNWEFEGAGSYTGEFKGGKPAGKGKFTFVNGVTQEGEYAAPVAAEEDEEPPEGEPTWKGNPVYTSVS